MASNMLFRLNMMPLLVSRVAVAALALLACSQ